MNTNNNNNNDNNNYVIEGTKGFSAEQFYKALKTKYNLFKVFERENPVFPEDLKENLKEFWEDIEFLTLSDCITEQNQEKKRILFSCYGPENIIKNANSKIIEKKEIIRKNKRVNDKNKIETYDLKEEYILYEIDRTYLGMQPKISWESDDNSTVKILKVVCPTTKQEYFLFVPFYCKTCIEAVCSTIRTNFYDEDIINIYRQGDILIFKVKENAKKTIEREIKEETYLDKIIWQS